MTFTPVSPTRPRLMYVLRHPELFAGVAEEFWSSTHDSGAAQEFLGRAFAAHRDDPRLQPALVRAIERWMGFIHPLGTRFWTFNAARNARLRTVMEAQTGKQVLPLADETGKGERVRQEIATRAGCPVVEGEIEVAGAKLTVISDGVLLRLARFGLMVMSAGDPSPFIHSLVQWAVAAAVMDDPGFSDLVEWVIRLSDRDVDSTLVEHARRLLLRKEAVASTAARFILSAIGSRESESLIEAHDLVSEWHKQLSAQHASDPCKSFLAWTERESLRCLARADVPLHIILERAALPIVDPAITLPCGLIQRAREALQAINPAIIRATARK